ncbi:MAG: hypothetical protein QXT45_04380 [Candidatus Bilamarchaeaceae archaeon]
MRKFLSIDNGIPKSYSITPDDIILFAANGILKVETFTITHTSPTLITLKTFSAPNVVFAVTLSVATPWSSGATVSIGTSSDPHVYLNQFSIDLVTKTIAFCLDFDLNDDVQVTINHASSTVGQLKVALFGSW